MDILVDSKMSLRVERRDRRAPQENRFSLFPIGMSSPSGQRNSPSEDEFLRFGAKSGLLNIAYVNNDLCKLKISTHYKHLPLFLEWPFINPSEGP